MKYKVTITRTTKQDIDVILEANTEEEAEDFAQGNWKDVSTHEAEALDF